VCYEVKVTFRLLFCIFWFIPMSWIVVLCLVLLSTCIAPRSRRMFCTGRGRGRSECETHWFGQGPPLQRRIAVIRSSSPHSKPSWWTFHFKMTLMSQLISGIGGCLELLLKVISKSHGDGILMHWLAFCTLSIVLFLFRATFRRLDSAGDRH
jgi:hypothetical protein